MSKLVGKFRHICKLLPRKDMRRFLFLIDSAVLCVEFATGKISQRFDMITSTTAHGSLKKAEEIEVCDVVELLGDAVLVFDDRDRILALNTAAAELFRLDSYCARLQSVLLFIPHCELRKFVTVCEAARQDGIWAGKLKMENSLGQMLILEVRLFQRPGSKVYAAYLKDISDSNRDEKRAVRKSRLRTVKRVIDAIANELQRDELAHVLNLLSMFSEPASVSNESIFDGNGEGVLLIAESGLACEITRLALESANYTVLIANDIDSINNILENLGNQIHAIVANCDASTFNLYRTISQITPAIPVVAIGISDSMASSLPPTWTPLEPLPPASILLAAVANSVAQSRFDGVEWAIR